MTSEDLERTVVRPAARRADHGRSRLVAVLAVLAVLGVAGLAIRDLYWSNRLEDVTSTAAANAEAAQSLADQVRDLGAEPRVPVPGTRGERGLPGRGIVSTVVTSDGHLVVTYTDGVTADLGAVSKDGRPGRGITTTAITDGSLVITYSDGTSNVVGPVVGTNGRPGADGQAGADGRGVASVDGSTGRLIVTYTDGTSEDAGPLPPGPEGPPGPPGESNPCPGVWEPTLFLDGRAGYRCLVPPSMPPS